MVKVSGKTRSPGHLKAHFDYSTRNGRLRAETSDGHVIQGREAMRHVHDDWVAANLVFGRGKPAPNASQSVSIILSMPGGTDPDRVQDAARAWAHANLTSNYDWIMVRHDDQQHPHVHITVRAVGHDGRRLAPGREELQRWREGFAKEMRVRGVDAEATPRPARGLVPVRHRQKPAREPWKPQRAPEEREKAREAWNARLQARQTGIRAAYLEHAADLAKGSATDRQLARDVERFVAELPVARARRDDLARELRRAREQSRTL